MIYALARYGSGIASFPPVLVLAVALTVVDGPTVADAAFVVFILTATWICGRFVARRTAEGRGGRRDRGAARGA